MLCQVVNVVSRVVDMLVHNGIIEQDDSESIEEERRSQRLSQGKRTQRQHIVNELVRTERTYVQHLDLLQTFKKEAEQQGLISGDIAYAMFLNLNQLLDVQRRFLIFVEEENGKDEEDQNWGRLFAEFGDNFGVYEAYIINQNTCEATAVQYFDKLRQIQGSPELVSIVESCPNLTGFLLKPFSRLCKYPLLLKELIKNGRLDEERCEDIQEGIAIVNKVLDSANRYVAKQEHHKIVQDLREQVEDWKNHRVELFGDLLLYGNFQVVKGDGMNTEREVSHAVKLRDINRN
jgi:cell division control protein 24